MKKLVLATILELGVFEMLDVASLNAAENLSVEQIRQFVIDCVNNENKVSCQKVIESSDLEQCNRQICNYIGYVLDFSADYQQAMKYYKKAADLGNAWGYNNLGVLYYEGKGVRQNFSEAFKLFKKASDLNLADAYYNLANLYRQGEGTRQDFANARKYYEKACDADIANSCNNLGGLYVEGKGIKQNHSTAKKYYGKACDLGFQMGCDNYKWLNEMGVK